MLLIGPGGPLQLNYHGRPPAKRQTTLARQQFQSNDPGENRTVAAVKDQRTLNSPSASEPRGVWVASTAPTGLKSVVMNKRLWCRAPTSSRSFFQKSSNGVDDVIGGQWWKGPNRHVGSSMAKYRCRWGAGLNLSELLNKETVKWFDIDGRVSCQAATTE